MLALGLKNGWQVSFLLNNTRIDGLESVILKYTVFQTFYIGIF